MNDDLVSQRDSFVGSKVMGGWSVVSRVRAVVGIWASHGFCTVMTCCTGPFPGALRCLNASLEKKQDASKNSWGRSLLFWPTGSD